MSDDAPPWPALPVMLLSALLALISSAADRDDLLAGAC